ncbi:MAG: hypothetical protein HC809_03320 [Gammaproteobacteria bacterium]|nr:hypothetical protein [Gammaproteobacteria bacterium]
MWPWTILAIEPTRDASVIKRAYASLLKQTRPEDDPEGYALLSEAFDAAIAYARDAVAQAENRESSFPSESSAESAVAETTRQVPSAERIAEEWFDVFRERTEEANARKSTAVWQTLLAQPELDLIAVREMLAVRVFSYLSDWLAKSGLDRALSEKIARLCANRFDWIGRQLELDSAFDHAMSHRIFDLMDIAHRSEPIESIAVAQTGTAPWWRIPVLVYLCLMVGIPLADKVLDNPFGSPPPALSVVDVAMRAGDYGLVVGLLGERAQLSERERRQLAVALAATNQPRRAREHVDAVIALAPDARAYQFARSSTAA